jgi:hypothetical protein
MSVLRRFLGGVLRPSLGAVMGACQTHRQQHGAGFEGMHVMEHVRLQIQNMARVQCVVMSIRLYQQPPFQHVQRYQSMRRMIGQRATGCKRDKQLRDGGMVQEGYLTMTAVRRVRFCPQCPQALAQVNNLACASKASPRGRTQPLSLCALLLIVHYSPSMMA